ncbi:Uncharacterised protein [Salmonella enterica subsp. enterica serovar Typhi]|nr:Uncharacterised protein [Salmonella enterica subsp. enterica serovar Typhi]
MSRYQLLMAAIFSDTSFIDYDNNIAAASGGQSVRDDKRDAFLGMRHSGKRGY